MQVFPIVLIAAAMAVDAGVRPLGATWPIGDAALWGILWLGPMTVAVTVWWVLRGLDRRLSRGRGVRPLFTADAVMRWSRWAIVGWQLAGLLVFDGLGAVRRSVGDAILLDELLATMPALLAMTALWWAYYPIERRVIEHTIVRRLDLGAPVYDMPTRGQYVLGQTRINLLLLLVPVLVIAGLSEAIDHAWARWDREGRWLSARELTTALAALGVFVCSPMMARWVLQVQSLPRGELRDALTAVCARHDVGVRDLLLWQTNGTMINAAVMGLFPRLRYVLITDALVETLRAREVQAVMAHEVGHVRRRHMVWLILCLLACFALVGLAIDWPLRIAAYLLRLPAAWEGVLTVLSAALQLAAGLTLFGWVCRRFERQADTFAAQHLSGLGTAVEREATVTVEAVDAMRSALNVIADLNTIDPTRHSWRHGSIRWRQRYLDSLIGRPILTLPIDRVVSRVKMASALVLALGAAYWGAAELLAAKQPAAPAARLGPSTHAATMRTPIMATEP